MACRRRASAPEREASAPEAPALGHLRPLPGVELWTGERMGEGGHRTAWSVVRVELAKVEPQVRPARRARLENFVGERDVVLAINGGFFEPDQSPSGWLVSDGVTLAPAAARGGSGVFTLQGRRARIVAWDSDASLPDRADLALQCGPRLIEPDGTLGIRGDDGKRAARTALCVREDGAVLDMVLAWTRNSDRDGPTLLEMARWLAAPLLVGDRSGCEAALNLDGGPSTGLYLRDDPEHSHRPFGRVPFALVIHDSEGRR